MELREISYRSNNGYLRLASIAFFALFAISNLVSLPGIVTAVLGLCWVLFVPLGIGKLLLRSPVHLIKNLSSSFSVLGTASVYVQWSIGFLLIVSASLALISIGVNAFAIGTGWLLLSTFASVVLSRKTQTLSLSQNIKKIIIVSLILGISFAFYVRSFSPYPLTPGMDIFTHLYVIKSIVNNAVENSPLVYSPSFDVSIALGSSTFHADTVEIFWLGIFVLSTTFAFALYALSFWITRNHLTSSLSTIIGLLVTEQGLVSNLQFFFPSSVIMSIFPLTFLVCNSVLKQNLRKTQKLALLSFPIAVLLIIHSQVGLVATLLIFIYFAISHLYSRHRLVLPIVRLTTISMVVVLLLYYNGYITSQLHLTIIDGQYSYTTPIKIRHLDEWYTPQVITLSLIGLVVLSFFGRRGLFFSFIASLALLIYFQKIDWIHRFMTLERPLLSLAAATTLSFPLLFLTKMTFIQIKTSIQHVHWKSLPALAVFSNHCLISDLYHGMVISKTTAICFGFIIVLIFPILLQPYDVYLQPYTSNNIGFVNFTYEELNAAKWIEQNTPSDHRIYSDPYTVIEMRGLAYRKEIEGIGWNTTVANSVRSSLNSDGPAQAYERITSQYGNKVIIVIDSRTVKWIKSTDYFVQFPVNKFESFPGLDNFFDQRYFSLIYKSENVYVFLPNPK